MYKHARQTESPSTQTGFYDSGNRISRDKERQISQIPIEPTSGWHPPWLTDGLGAGPDQ
jgi:hypothetical protein